METNLAVAVCLRPLVAVGKRGERLSMEFDAAIRRWEHVALGDGSQNFGEGVVRCGPY
jgi:hypothetical protein